MENNPISFSKIKSIFFENRTIKQTILKNAFWLTLADSIVKTINFLVFIWFARYFGPIDYGKLTFALSFVAVFVFFVDFGFSTIVSREIAKDDSKTSQYISNVLIAESFLGVITFLIVLLSVIFLNKGVDVSLLICILCISRILDSITIFFQAVFCGKEKMEYVATSKIIQGTTSLALIFFLIFGNSIILINIGYTYLLASFISMICTMMMVRKRVQKFIISIDFVFLKNIIKESWPIGLISFSALVFQSLDSIIIGLTRTNQEVGLYNASSRIAFGTYFLLGILFSIFLPPISRAFKEKGDLLYDIVRKYAFTIIGLGLPIGIGGLIISNKLINFLYGSDYYESIIPFKILSMSLILIFINGFYGHCLIFFDKQKSFLKANLFGIIVNLVLNIILIPKFGMIGASIVAVITQFCILFLSYVEFKKIVKFRIYDIFILLFSAVILMGLSVFIAMRLFTINLISLILIGVFVYFLVLYFIFLLIRKYHINFQKIDSNKINK